MKTERRWLKSMIAAAAEPLPALPWDRALRSSKAATDSAPTKRPAAMAAR